ncbi:MAG: phenylacetate--CoA ligase, partial [Rhodospirillales bacterium]|nr:phenylacetate--CoA ligase [Rhodospirillales bacterium]
MSNDTHDGYMYDRAVETMSRDQLSQVQLKKLKTMVAHASANVAYYQNSFAAAGLTAENLQTLEDFEKFPFTVKKDLRDKYPFDMFAVPRQDVVRIHASSGTTGKPTVVGYTQDDLDTWTDVMARTLACAGVRPGDLVHNAYGYGLFTGGLGAHY